MMTTMMMTITMTTTISALSSSPTRGRSRGQGQVTTGDEGIRTLDLRIANATLSQLSYVPGS